MIGLSILPQIALAIWFGDLWPVMISRFWLPLLAVYFLGIYLYLHTSLDLGFRQQRPFRKAGRRFRAQHLKTLMRGSDPRGRG